MKKKTKNNTAARSSSIKDWLAYLEDDKTKVIQLTHDHAQTEEMKAICKELGLKILGYCAFEHEADARYYADRHFRE